MTDVFLDTLGLKFPNKNEINENTAKTWIEKSLKPVLVDKIEILTKETREFGIGERVFTKQMKKELMDKMKRLHTLSFDMQINKFLQHYKQEDWILVINLKIEYMMDETRK